MKIPRLWISLDNFTSTGIKLILIVLYQGHIDDYKFATQLALTCKSIKDMLEPIRTQLILFIKMENTHRLIDSLRQVPNVYHGIENYKDIYERHTHMNMVTYTRHIKGNKLDLSSCFMGLSKPRTNRYPFSIHKYGSDLLSEELQEFEFGVEMNYLNAPRNTFAPDFRKNYNPKSWISVIYYPLHNHFMYYLV